MAKNPFMSAFLSAANRVASTARGKTTNEVKRQHRRQATAAMDDWFDAWSIRAPRGRKRR